MCVLGVPYLWVEETGWGQQTSLSSACSSEALWSYFKLEPKDAGQRGRAGLGPGRWGACFSLHPGPKATPSSSWARISQEGVDSENFPPQRGGWGPVWNLSWVTAGSQD